MDIVSIIIIIVVAVILVLTFYVIGVYNRLVDARSRVEDKFSLIDIELKKKSNLIPSLVDIVKDSVKHEEKLLTEVENAKNKFDKTNNINDEIKNSKSIDKALNKIFALAQSYPELKKNKSFLSLEKEFRNIDDKIDYASSFYNDVVLNYNNLRDEFFVSVVASVFKFNEISYFKIDTDNK